MGLLGQIIFKCVKMIKDFTNLLCPGLGKSLSANIHVASSTGRFTYKMKIEIFTDGGALNNPGPAAIGVVIKCGDRIKKYAEKIKDSTNNQAEYLAVIFALKKLKLLFGKAISKEEITLHLDSELVGNQLLGRYKIKDKELAPLFIKFWNLKIDLPNLKIKIIPREKNIEADKLVKSVLFKKELFNLDKK